MAKKKAVKKESISKVTEGNVKDYLKQVGFDGKCFVTEDGNVFLEESVARSHALKDGSKYFKG